MPSAVFAKMNLKEQREIFVLDAPATFEREVSQLVDVQVRRKVTPASRVTFGLAFVMTQAQVDAAAAALTGNAEGDAVVWMAYPKGTSKKYTSTINRDHGWDALGNAGFEPVRMVAIDEDWSAVRFRRAVYIKAMTRDPKWAMSRAGKAKAARARATTKKRS